MSFDLLKKSIVRILQPNGETAGTGFVVRNDGLIATCAHVVQSDSAQRRGDPVPEKRTIVFHATGEQRTASIELDWWRTSKMEDVAILRVEGGLPEGIQPLPLGFSGNASNHPFVTFGFPKSNPKQGIWGEGHVLDATEISNVQVVQLSSKEVTPGFSGAPVVEHREGQPPLVIGMVTSIIPPDDFGRQAETAFMTPIETLRVICPELIPSSTCPYRNLNAFTEADAAFFFGRQQVVNEQLEKLRSGNRFLALLGSSGSGKSSVVQAGLIPLLRQNTIADSSNWEFKIIRPADDPFKELMDQGIIDETRNLKAGMRAWLDKNNKDMFVLIIDQFEEIFVNCPEPLRQEFVSQLSGLLQFPMPVTIILTMRVDFYSYATRYDTLAKWLGSNAINISSSLTVEDVTAMIQKPAQAAGLSVAKDLTTRLILELQNSAPDEQGSGIRSTILPLLEFALTQLWEVCHEKGILTVEAYDQIIGGITGSLGRWADKVLGAIVDDRSQRLSRHIFTDLVYLGDESQGRPDIRQRKLLASLVLNEVEKTEVSQLVQYFVQKRLLVVDQDILTKEDTVELIHESLIKEWGTLKNWLAEDRSFLTWHQWLKERLRDWVVSSKENKDERDEYKLLGGRELVGAASKLNTRATDLSDEEQDFIRVSLERTRQKEEHERQEEVKREELSKKAEQQHQIALARQLATHSEELYTNYPHLLEQSALLAVEALQRFPSPETDQAVRRSLALLGRCLATLPDQEGRNSKVVSTPVDVLVGRQQFERIYNITRLVFSPRGDLLVTVGKAIDVWEVGSRRLLMSLLNEKIVTTVLFSRDQRLLATYSGGDEDEEGWVQVWDLTSESGGRSVARLSCKGGISAVSFGFNEYLLACPDADNRSIVKVWEVINGHCLATLPHDDAEEHVTALAFSPNGQFLAIAYMCKELDQDDKLHYHIPLKIWDTASGRLLTTLSHIGEYSESNSLNTLVFSADGSLLVSINGGEGFENGSAQIWTMPGNQHVRTIPCEERVVEATFNNDGRFLAIMSMPKINIRDLIRGVPDNRQSVQVWEVASGRLLVAPEHKDDVKAIAFSHDSNILATASKDETAVLWDVASGRRLAILPHQGTVSAVTFHPDDHMLATSANRTIAFWEIAPDPFLTTLLHKNVTEAMFSPDNSLLVTTGESENIAIRIINTAVQVWEVSTGRRLSTQPGMLNVNAVAFNTNGRLLANTGENIGKVFEVKPGAAQAGSLSIDIRPSSSASSSSERIDAAVFSSDATLLATYCSVSSDRGGPIRWTYIPGPLQVWDASSGRCLVTLSSGSDKRVVIFGPDNSLLVTVNNTNSLPPGLDPKVAEELGPVEIWEVSSGQRIAGLLHNGCVNALFSPDGHFLVTISDGGMFDPGSIRVWEIPGFRSLVELDYQGKANKAAFSSDGHFLAVATEDRTAVVWEISSGCRLATLAHQEVVNDVAFSPDGRFLVTASDDRTALVWEIASERQMVRKMHEGSVKRAIFSPDGRYVVTCDNSAVLIWLWRPNDLIVEACSRLRWNLTPQEWQRYIGDEPYHKTCANLP